MTTTKRVVVAMAALGVLLVSSVASAQTPGKKANAKEDKDAQGYGYTFDDDPLAAGGFGPGDATIRVRPKGVRTTPCVTVT